LRARTPRRKGGRSATGQRLLPGQHARPHHEPTVALAQPTDQSALFMPVPRMPDRVPAARTGLVRLQHFQEQGPRRRPPARQTT
jgi:hypothetical protein